jgi:riboflavin biosynthesis pyrimidine reductase
VSDFDGVNRLITIEDRSSEWPVTPIGNEWSREYFDGPFYLFNEPADLPAISLVFVQTADGNTGADNPSDLGGGPTDLHLIYEGLSRVAADAVLAGASSVGPKTFFTVKHPQLVALRLALGFPRHPQQIVLSTKRRHPDAAIVIDRVAADVFEQLRREHGIRRISCIGGRTTATSLVDAGLVQDIYLTTTAINGGEPNTPWYVGKRPPKLETIVRKKEVTDRSPLLFEHLAIVRSG